MKSGYDLSRLIKFTLREDWRDALEDAMAEHVGLAQEEFGVEFEEIGDAAGLLAEQGEVFDGDGAGLGCGWHLEVLIHRS